jgi:hypothetical protein
MDFSKITDKAKSIFQSRGGTEALKEDATELKDIATGEGSLGDKAKEAVEAIKDPGAADERPAEAAQPAEPAEPAKPVEPASSSPGPSGSGEQA